MTTDEIREMIKKARVVICPHGVMQFFTRDENLIGWDFSYGERHEAMLASWGCVNCGLTDEKPIIYAEATAIRDALKAFEGWEWDGVLLHNVNRTGRFKISDVLVPWSAITDSDLSDDLQDHAECLVRHDLAKMFAPEATDAIRDGE